MPLRCLRLAVPLTIPLPHEPHGFRAMARALEDKDRALLKVKSGQQVYIRPDNYPYQEFGMLAGTVQSISLVPRNDSYAIEVQLPRGLRTNFDRPLDFRQEMQGSAEIITEELRLLERIFYQIRRILKNQP
jgi:hypothetical protein